MIYDKTKPPFADSVEDWEDFCDYMNNEGEYANQEPGKPKFPKSLYFITTNEPDPQIDGISELEKFDETVSWFDRKLKEVSKLPKRYFDALINRK